MALRAVLHVSRGVFSAAEPPTRDAAKRPTAFVNHPEVPSRGRRSEKKEEHGSNLSTRNSI